jgi:hypothetical protein
MNPFILYDNRYLDGTPAATDTATGYDVNNIRDWRPYTFWMGSSLGTKYLTVNCGSAKAADSLFLLGHNLYTVGATISVECSSDNFASDVTVALAGFTVTDNKAVIKTFASKTKQYWRIKLASCSAAPYLAVALLGARMDFPSPPESPFDPYNEGIEADAPRSVEGNLLESVVRYHPVEITAIFRILTRTWVLSTYRAFWDNHGKLLKPFAWCWDIVTYANLVHYLSLTPDARFSMPVSLKDYVDEIVLPMEGIAEI